MVSTLDSRLSSDYWVQLAWWVGLVALALTIVIALQIIDMRRSTLRRAARDAALTHTWRPVLNAALMGIVPERLPPLASRDMMSFLNLWLHLHQSVRGGAGDALNTIGRRLQCELVARRLLRRGSRAQVIVATLVLGHLRERAAWADLSRQVHGADSAPSILALWALVQIDAAAAASEIEGTLLLRADWPVAQLATILQTARDVWEPVLTSTVAAIDTGRLPGALRLMAALRLTLPAPVLQAMLAHPDPDVVIAALRLATTTACVDQVRAHLGHAHWQVRVQAARALAPLGNRDDVGRLQALLFDREWWVRYRGAQALARLPFLSPAELTALAAGDRFAADIVRHVLAEQDNA